jgi:hypothetical protein
VVADVVTCPVSSCRNALSVEVQPDRVSLSCANCGWSKVIKREE